MKFWKIIGILLALAALAGAAAYLIGRLVPGFSCPVRSFIRREKPEKPEKPEPFIQEQV